MLDSDNQTLLTRGEINFTRHFAVYEKVEIEILKIKKIRSKNIYFFAEKNKFEKMFVKIRKKIHKQISKGKIFFFDKI